jgi:hypothetical protein
MHLREGNSDRSIIASRALFLIEPTARRGEESRALARDKAMKIWVDGLTHARVGVRAEEAGTTLSEYVRDLLVKDANDGGRADALAGEVLEMQYLTAMLLRALLGKTLGETEAGKLVERAKVKAHEQAQAALVDLRRIRKTGT